MIYQNICLHNIQSVVSIENVPGVLLQRVPNELLSELKKETAWRYQIAAGAELRFVCSNQATVVLSCPDGMQTIYLHHGDYYTQAVQVGKEPTAIPVNHAPFLDGCAAHLPTSRFAPCVRRVLLPRARVCLLEVDGKDLRPPAPNEVPSLRFLAYGTSITEGVAASQPELSYISQTSALLNADAINLGAAGAAYLEPAIASYIAERNDWDFAVLCVSVNMLNQGFTASEFYKRAEHMVTCIRRAQPKKHLFCIGLFPFFMDMGMIYPGRNPTSTPDEYRVTLRGVVENHNTPYIHYLDGLQLCTKLTGLSSDLLHPSDRGMAEIAANLANYIKNVIASGGSK